MLTIISLGDAKLIRTPEGVAIWIAHTMTADYERQLPQVWKGGHPLAKKAVSTLSEVMKDAKGSSENLQISSNLESQGNAMWSPQLHFAWDIVLLRVYGPNKEGTRKDLLSFATFWLRVVDGKSIHRLCIFLQELIPHRELVPPWEQQ